jgi:ABC-type sugar transport system permease subunit
MKNNLVKFNKKRLNYKQKEALTGFMFILPWIIGIIAFVSIPLIRTIYFSFNNVRFSGSQGYIYEWVGLLNYKRILTVDVDFIYEAQNFLFRIIIYVPVIIALSVFIAILLNSKIKGTAFFRLVFFMPVIILSGPIFDNIRNNQGFSIQSNGLIYTIINSVVPPMVVSGVTLLFQTVSEVLWYCGVPILLFLAALQKIDQPVYESAEIDGASSWDIFWKITLPAIYPLVYIAIVYIVVLLGNFDANPILSIIEDSRLNPSRREGYASAMSLLYAVLQTVLIIVLYFIFRPRKEEAK